ncbi:Nicotinate-nucleotide--dimethylbenzimidazole phosphoribosyltransferase [Caballeronia sp. SBC1]|uniref:nicotinate-nucleotide--dimethylbenzimidazole phosphoribosyltransferase n=1 Tax=unclassified Caballeronia TaxID=2646786 RepID=UPI0013E175A8|nr:MULTISPECIES: nicotinate-nucleotide--dimethylbenzimidazole phosphoribosyltransferase [unclassified Caballeronia]QIE22807.1 Nicotinate-nucleotide--dimethylbenzimidazole phosphoribosyltransferase [Caballeronia sp. SBC2]QIN60835.1 Nicotinate-nucleotide--dimethylbenzimidazole phosphoribosyltransferase [Caballeronia sp. SBC1]
MNDTLPRPEPLDRSMAAELQHVIDTKTKPPGSLGRLESLGLQIGLIQQTLRPRIERPAIIVFAGDHGIAAEGVSPFPQEVTVQMVANFIAGGAAINALSKASGMTLEVVDAGVASASSVAPAAGFVDAAIRRGGTRNFAHEPAMTHDEALQAIERGAARVRFHAALGTNVIGFGEMGIANTSAAACLMSRICNVEIEACVGRGTGLDDAGLNHKRDVLAAALKKHAASTDPLETLATFGGFEIAMIVGAFLAAAEARMTILVDGFIVTSALLVAHALNPAVLDYCVFAHASDETGHRRMLEHFNAAPLLQLGLRLGEGTGAALALPLLRAAVAFINEMASFESAGVSDKAV